MEEIKEEDEFDKIKDAFDESTIPQWSEIFATKFYTAL